MRARLDLSYDGTDFHGWAKQDGLRSVQGVIEHWLTTILRTPIELTVAGRTDAGVHASGQVAHLDLAQDTDLDMLFYRLTRVLPQDIVLQKLSSVPEEFDARFSAIWRQYRYRLWQPDSLRNPLLRHFYVPLTKKLDIDLMNQASKILIGLHDFTAFCKAREGATAIRNLQSLKVEQLADRSIEITVRSDAFCHSMVRSMVGALVSVGQHQRDLDWLTSLLGLAKRSNEVSVMPAKGLTLEEVGYPPNDKLAERATQARAKRELNSANFKIQ